MYFDVRITILYTVGHRGILRSKRDSFENCRGLCIMHRVHMCIRVCLTGICGKVLQCGDFDEQHVDCDTICNQMLGS